MGYYLKTKPKKDKSLRWQIMYRIIKDGVTTTRVVPRIEWPAIGFNPDMDIEAAKDRVKQLNARDHITHVEAKRNSIHKMLRKQDKILNAHLPEKMVAEFENNILLRKLSRMDKDSLVESKILSHWRAVKNLIKEIELDPIEWNDYPEVIYRYFEKKQISPSYAQKMLRILNLWGFFCAKKNSTAFLPVEPPGSRDRSKIADAYLDKNPDGKASDPLTPKMLEKAKGEMLPENYTWLYIALWFGLRPSEVDQLDSPIHYKIENDGTVDIFWVYQPKLTGLPRAQRWKLIPILYPEQAEALKLVQSKGFRRPLVKTIHRYFGERVNLYGPRKNFTDMMLERGQLLEHISGWMGHTNVDRTWRSYKQKNKAHYKKTA